MVSTKLGWLSHFGRSVSLALLPFGQSTRFALTFLLRKKVRSPSLASLIQSSMATKLLIEVGWIKDIPYVISQKRRVYLVHPNAKLPGGTTIVRCGSDSQVYDFLGAYGADHVLPLTRRGNQITVYLNGEIFGDGLSWLALWADELLLLPEKTDIDGTIFPGLDFGIIHSFSRKEVRAHSRFDPKMISPKKFDHTEEVRSRGGVAEYYDHLTEDFPRLKYSEKIARQLPNVHMGQDKLFFSELEFLVKLGAPGKKVLVIYPGGGPGTHIPLLASLTKAKFILIDPAFKNKKLNPISPTDDIVIFPQLFDVDQWLEMNGSEGFDEIALISDIRSEPRGVKKGSKEYAKKFDDEIRNNMAMQREWFLKIRESLGFETKTHFHALFKFRLTWEPGKTIYLKGTRFFQVFAKSSSTEVRLMTNSPEDTKYDRTMAEEQLFFFNSKYRLGSFLDINPVFGVNYDLLKASKIIESYFEAIGVARKDINEKVCLFFLELDDYFSKHRKPYYSSLMSSW